MFTPPVFGHFLFLERFIQFDYDVYSNGVQFGSDMTAKHLHASTYSHVHKSRILNSFIQNS